MPVKPILIGVCVLSQVLAIVAWMYWSDVVSRHSTADWNTWQRKVEAIWKFIPVAMAVSVTSGVASLLVKPRTRDVTLVALAAVGAALVIAGLMWFISTGFAVR